jgi:hypothetical protein
MNTFILVVIIYGSSVSFSPLVSLKACQEMEMFVVKNRGGAVTKCIDTRKAWD